MTEAIATSDDANEDALTGLAQRANDSPRKRSYLQLRVSLLLLLFLFMLLLQLRVLLPVPNMQCVPSKCYRA